ncbi:hypothetical protein KAF25_007908 [Fusarium avenaceum]|uniref:Zn(2)-C6 fungal-type domain-containing protein n=1 Tax=Fusarium avenaceum TaxID=40199 RepID=A0A9P7GYQ0_9HYPO|nr:hypothetical protein KAF25_007908 [Fusarium avenaceum]
MQGASSGAPASTLPRFRKLLPASEQNPESTSSRSASASETGLLSPGTRAPLTKTACERCRKRKIKCGGERPTCKSCLRKGFECDYQTDQFMSVRKRKYDEIEERAGNFEQLYNLLRCLPEQDSQSILQRLRQGADVPTMIRQVKDGNLILQLAWAPNAQLQHDFPHFNSMPAALLSPGADSPLFQQTKPQSLPHARGRETELEDPHLPDIQVSKWTAVEQDDELLRTLLRSYFLHDYANYTCFQKDIFLCAMKDDDHRFCSALLVNSILAQACHSYRGATHRAQFRIPETLGGRFLTEAERLWRLESGRSSLTTLHAAMVLHIIYTVNGRDEVGISYLLQSVQMAQDLQLFTAEETEGTKRTARVFTAWALYRWQSMQGLHCSRAPLIREPPTTPMPNPDQDGQDSWYGELWLRHPPSPTIIPMHFGHVFRAQTELRRIANEIACIRFGEEETARNLTEDELAQFRNALDRWYEAVPDPIKSHNAVLPCQLIMHMEYCILLFKVAQMVADRPITSQQASPETPNHKGRPSGGVAYALRCLETVLRVYYLRWSFEHTDTFLTYFLSILADMTIESMNSASISPNDEETLKILRATLILCVKGLYDQGQHIFVSSIICRLMQDRMTDQDMNELRRCTTWEDNQPLVPQYTGGAFPVNILKMKPDEGWKIETIENLAKKYNQLALEATENKKATFQESTVSISPRAA